MAVPDLDQHGGRLREVILEMKQKWPVTHVAERVALLIEDVDGQRIAWFCAFDENRTGYRIPVIALLSHGEQVFGGGMLRHAGAAAARVLGFDDEYLARRHSRNRRRPSIEHRRQLVTGDALHM